MLIVEAVIQNGILNSLYTCNQFTTCTEGTVYISDVSSIHVSLRDCATKASLFVGQRYKRCNCKILCRNNFCLCSKSNKLLNSNAIIVCHVKTNDIRVGIHHDLFIYFFCFSFRTNWCNEKYTLSVFFEGKNFILRLHSYLSLFPSIITICYVIYIYI